MAKYNNALAVLLNNGENQILPVSKAQLIELAYSQSQGQFGTGAKDVAAALTYLLNKSNTDLDAAKTYTGEQINALDGFAKADTGYVLSYVVETDGVITKQNQVWLDASVVSYRGVGDGAPTTVQGAIEDIQTTLADLAGDGQGSVQSQITTALDALDLAQVSDTGKPITYVSQENGQVSAGTGNINAQYVNVDNTSLGWDIDESGTADTDVTVQSAIAYLDSQITALETGAARYSIEKKTENLAANVKEQYVLKQTVNGATTDVQVPINIYKDSQLLAAAVSTTDATYSDGQIVAGTETTHALVLVYSVYDSTENVWTEEVVHIPVADFFSELTAGNGLTESNGVINVVKGANSENFLTVNADSIEITGVQNAINTAEQTAKTYAEGLINNVDAEVVADNSGTSYVLTGVKLEGDNNTLEFTSYTGVALTDENVKTTFAATDDPIAALVPTGGQNPENVKEALDLIASSLSALTGTAPIDTINGDDNNTYVKISTNKVGSEVTLTVDDSYLGNVAHLQYDELSTLDSNEMVTILNANA